MKFDLSEEQELLRTSTADVMASEFSLETSRQASETSDEGFSRTQWKKLAELGYLGLLASEGVGGQGLGAIELAVVCEEMGKVCFAGPYLDTLVATRLLEDSGDQNALVTKIVAGQEIVVCATVDRVWPTQAMTASLRAGHLTGTKYFVPYATAADRMLVRVADAVVLAEGPFRIEPMETFEEAARFGEVEFDHDVVAIADAHALDALSHLTAVAAAAHALGLCESSLSRAVAYSRQRETFGKPIGSYQVLQHRMADMLLRTESARSAVYRAAWCVANDDPDAALVAAAAKAYTTESARRIAEDCVQIHGGNGFTWEYDVHCFLKRALTLERHDGDQKAMAENALVAFEARQ